MKPSYFSLGWRKLLLTELVALPIITGFSYGVLCACDWLIGRSIFGAYSIPVVLVLSIVSQAGSFIWGIRKL